MAWGDDSSDARLHGTHIADSVIDLIVYTSLILGWAKPGPPEDVAYRIGVWAARMKMTSSRWSSGRWHLAGESCHSGNRPMHG